MTVILTLLLAGALAAEPPAKPKPVPTPKELGAEMMRSTFESVGGLEPQVQPFVLFYVGRATAESDRKKGMETLLQAWSDAYLLDTMPGIRADLQGRIAQAVGEINLAHASELIRTMRADKETVDARNRAVDALVQKLLIRGKFDDAMDLLAGVSSNGPYPFQSANALLTKMHEMNPDDGRREIVFGNALTAYLQTPSEDFVKMLGKNWRTLQRASVQRALDAAVAHVLEEKDDPVAMQVSYGGAKGPVSFAHQQDRELFEILGVLREVEPKAAEDILRGHPELAASAGKYPDGMDSMGQPTSMSMGMGAIWKDADADAAAQARVATAESMRDFARAMDVAGGISNEAIRAWTIARIAANAGSRQAISLASRLLSDGKQSDAVCDAWSQLFTAAHKLPDAVLEGRLLGSEIYCADVQFSIDSNVDDPNLMPKDWWPAASAYREAMVNAVTFKGVEAPPFLAGVKEPNMHALAEVAMAEALLGHKSGWNKGVMRKPVQEARDLGK